MADEIKERTDHGDAATDTGGDPENSGTASSMS